MHRSFFPPYPSIGESEQLSLILKYVYMGVCSVILSLVQYYRIY